MSFSNPLDKDSQSGREAMRWIVFKELYLERLEVRHPGSDHPANARRTLDKFTSYCGLVERDLSDITNMDLDRFIKKRTEDSYRGKPLTNRTINNEIDIVNTALGYAGPKEARGPRRKNLGLLLMPPYGERLLEEVNNPVALNPDQLKAFMEATKGAKTPRFPGVDPQVFWMTAGMLALVTSLRRKALLLIPRPDEYTLKELKQVVLPAKLSKTRTEQRISLGSQAVVDIVASLPSKIGEPLLPWKDKFGNQMGLDHFNHALCAMQRKAGVKESERIKLKHMRSTAGTEILDHFGDAIAKKKLGHSPKSNTIDKNYKSRRVSKVDVKASQHLANMYLGQAQQLQLFPPEAEAEAG